MINIFRQPTSIRPRSEVNLEEDLPTILPKEYVEGLKSNLHTQIAALRNHVDSGGGIEYVPSSGLSLAVTLGDIAMGHCRPMVITDFMDVIAGNLPKD